MRCSTSSQPDKNLYACVCVHVCMCMWLSVSVLLCACAVIKKSIASGGQAMNIYERRVLSSVREVFFVFVVVFYIW